MRDRGPWVSDELCEDSAPLFDMTALEGRAADLRDAYAHARPFPHIVIDGFLQPACFDEVVAELAAGSTRGWTNYVHLNERKVGNPRPQSWGPTTRLVAATLMSPAFVSVLESITGIEGLRADPYFDGGGLHRTARGGFLNIHTDFTAHHTHPEWRRRVNLLLYLNRNWDESFGGELELWDSEVSRKRAGIAPIGNRMVAFSTDERSFHGHPDPLRTPPGVFRDSLALYYFTVDEANRPRATTYRSRPGDGLRGLAAAVDNRAVQGYDWVKRRFGISDDFVSRLLGWIRSVPGDDPQGSDHGTDRTGDPR